VVVDLRNEFIHMCSMDVRYKIGLSKEEKPTLELKPNNPEITFGPVPIMEFDTKVAY